MNESKERQCFFTKNPEELVVQIKHAHSIPQKILIKLREQYFGDPYKNGGKWVVDRLEEIIEEKKAN